MAKRTSGKPAQKVLLSGQRASTWQRPEAKKVTPSLTRERIVAASMQMAHEKGIESVSIRNLAKQLDSSPMALYHYVPSKRDLLNLMLDATHADFVFPSDGDLDWRSILSSFAWQTRRSFERYPWSISLRTDDREYGPAAIRVLEWYLERLSRLGLDVRFAVRVLSVVFDFVIGFVFSERLAQPGAEESSRTRQHIFSDAVLATGQFPNVTKFVSLGIEASNDAAFERSLSWILNGLASDIPSSGNAKSSNVVGFDRRKRR